MICLRADVAVEAMLELNQKSGLLCGPSSGAQYAAIKNYFSKNPVTEESNIVFIACDRMEWYISYIKKYRPDIFGLNKHSSIMAHYVDQKIAVNYQVAANDLDQWLTDEEPTIIDMRTPASLKVLSFDGAINIPEKNLEDIIEKNQPFPKGKKVLFICAVGQKSLKIAAYLRDKSVEAYSLENGVVGYQKSLKENRNKKEPNKVVSLISH